ncbi:hypothetical protein [Leptothoe sp. PORK10 BA2]|uniref:hypothetical protein n=1 Tax=Leptothoe sp. PORK10 BA2 TaxID=3110254 RepID=UPI002B200110|nr:hypothetical protein [Leptothoe sp. PORK10 BA2]MEA5464503.1 hypothetical protein [Leptothoe sp. PORK10 BA2]
MAKTKKSATDMFSNLADMHEQQSESSKAAEPTAQRKRKKTGKRSDPNYIQVGAYIPKNLNEEVKIKLVRHNGDFSDLITELLEKWITD